MPRLRCKINELDIIGLVDTAATANFIQLAVLSEDQRASIRLHPVSVELAVPGTALKVMGEIDITLVSNLHSMNLSCLVSEELREALIFGLPWIQEQKVVIDIPEGILYAGIKERFPLYLTTTDLENQITALPKLEIKDGFPSEYQDEFRNLASRFRETLDSQGKLTQTRSAQHEIKITTTKPFRLRPYPCSEERRKFIMDQVQEMLAENVIEPCNSQYCSPIVLAKKKDGGYRFCIDFRRLNSITEDATHTLPRIQDSLKELGKATIFSAMDLQSGYWQVPLHPDSRKLTAFAVPHGGTYQFKVMPFGLKNAPITFQCLMSQVVLRGYINKFCIVYLDDIIVYSRTWKEHLYHLALIFERLQLHGLTCVIKKCTFGQTELRYLGHTISSEYNEPQEQHVEAILQATPPQGKRGLQQFLGICNWVREYVPDFAELTAPLTNLLQKNRKWAWTEEANIAFERVKELFKSDLRLARPDPQLKLQLQISLSENGMGAVLCQTTSDDHQQVISYASAKFNDVERRYPTMEKEGHALVWAIRHYRPLLEEKEFLVKSHPNVLKWLTNIKETKNKFGNWLTFLEKFKFTISPRAVRDHVFSHALALQPGSTPTTDLEADEEGIFPPERTTNLPLGHHQLTQLGSDNFYVELYQSQQEDEEISKLASKWTSLANKVSLTDQEETFRQNNLVTTKGFHRRSGDRWLLWIPEASQQRVLFEYHDVDLAGHPGADETLRAIQEHFYWVGMREQVKDYVRSCRICNACKPFRNTHPVPQRPRQPKTPWDMVAVDLMGPYPRSSRGRKFLFVVTDLCSRWVEAFPLGSSTTVKLVKVLETEVFQRFGYPRVLLSDNGPQFVSKQWLDACTKWGCEAWTTPVYHPQANPTERRNQTIKVGLRMQLVDHDHRDWDRKLTEILFNLRTRKNAASGKTPSQVLFGETIARPGQWVVAKKVETDSSRETRLQEVREHQTQYLKNKQAADSEPCYKEKDWVRVRTHHLSDKAKGFNAGLAVKWEGPYQILERRGGEVYEVDQGERRVKVHFSDLRPVYPERLQVPSPQIEDHVIESESNHLGTHKRKRGRPPRKKKNPDMGQNEGFRSNLRDSVDANSLERSMSPNTPRRYNLRPRVINRQK